MPLLSLFRRRHPRETSASPHPAPLYRRHLEGLPYILPKDELEKERIDFQHHLLRTYIIKGLYLAPIGNQVSDILDVGTGSGRWAYDMARLFPQAIVTGLDKEATRRATAPTNVRFQLANVLESIPYADATFDFVHQRLLVGAIPIPHWPLVVVELARVTRPGGYVELVETGFIFHQVGPAMRRFLDWGLAAGAQVGIDLTIVAHLDTFLRDAGLQYVHQHLFPVEIGHWGGKKGELAAKNTYAGFESLKDFYMAKLGLSEPDFLQTLQALPAEWERYHTVGEVYVAYGQKTGRF